MKGTDVRCPGCGSIRSVRGNLPIANYPIVDGMHERRCYRCRPRRYGPRLPTSERKVYEARVLCPTCGEEREVKTHPSHAKRVGRCRFVKKCRYCAAGTPPELRDADWLRRRYEEISAVEIARLLGTQHGVVCKWLRRHGIPVRGYSEATAKAMTTNGKRTFRNRQMVTGRPYGDLPGAVRHL